jgi:hypothetical protein
MSSPVPRSAARGATAVPLARRAVPALARVLAGCVFLTVAVCAPPYAQTAQLLPAAEPFDPEVVLPARVDAALHRTFAAVERSVAAVDDRRRADARRALRAAAPRPRPRARPARTARWPH